MQTPPLPFSPLSNSLLNAPLDRYLPEWFLHYAEANDGQTALERLYAHPILLEPQSITEIGLWLMNQLSSQTQALSGRYQLLQNYAGQLDLNPNAWLYGYGPIETLAQQVLKGDITLKQACQNAATEIMAISLSTRYVKILTSANWNQAIDGNWKESVPVYLILFSALDAQPDANVSYEQSFIVTKDWLEVVSIACNDIPDGHLFYQAEQRANDLLEIASKNQDTLGTGILLHRLGVLYLDTFASGRNSRRYWNEYRLWQHRLVDAFGSTVLSDQTRLLPEPLQAFEKALEFFERALPYRTGKERGRTLKVMTEALMWRELLGGEPARATAKQLGMEALSLLPAGEEDTYCHTLISVLDFMAHSPVPTRCPGTDSENLEVEENADVLPSELSKVVSNRVDEDNQSLAQALNFQGDWEAALNQDPMALVAEYGHNTAFEYFLRAAETALRPSPETAVQLLRQLWLLLIKLDLPEESSINEGYLQTASNLFANALFKFHQAADKLEAQQLNVEKACQDILDSDTDNASAIEAIIAMAAATTAKNLEGRVLPFLEYALSLAQAGDTPEETLLIKPLQLSYANLLIGEAVNCYRQQDWAQATRYYMQAILALLSAQLNKHAIEILERAEDTATRSEAANQVFIRGLSFCAPKLQVQALAHFGDRIQLLWRQAFGRLLANSHSVDVEMLWLFVQAAKGGVFATVFYAPQIYDWEQDAQAVALLDKIKLLQAKMEAQTTTDKTILPPAVLDNEDLLVAYSTGDFAQPGNSDEILLTNRQRYFDAYVTARLVSNHVDPDIYLESDEIASLLGPDTALISQYIGALQDGPLALLTALITRENQDATIGVSDSLPGGVIMMGDGNEETEATMHFYGPYTAAIRRQIQEEPGPAVVVPEGADYLEGAKNSFFGGGLWEKLEPLRKQGKKHLCINAHGPLHFLPQHLMGPQGQTLADDWTVTYLPHISLLRAKNESANSTATREYPVVSFGLDFQNNQPHHQRPLPNACAEAQSVAAALGGICWLNEEATETRLFEAFQSARRIHLGTHGSHQVTAPLFQRVYLSPDADSDGSVYAYKILGQELSGVDLVTLSACETSLGRFDVNDTPRGLPSALLLSGVNTVIGCLWPVLSDASHLFFTTLYQALANNQTKREAFRTAQLTVKQAYPAYRDWGAFCYLGRW